MIGIKDGAPHYYSLQPSVIDDIEPYGNLNLHIVVGIVRGKLQVCPWKYTVHQSTKDLKLLDFAEVVKEAAKNPVRTTIRDTSMFRQQLVS